MVSDDEETNSSQNFNEKNYNKTKGIGLVKVIENVDFGAMSMTEKPTKPLYALILTPTRELAVQIKNHITLAAKYMDIKVNYF